MINNNFLKLVLATISILFGFTVSSTVLAVSNVHTISDPQEISDFTSGFDIAKVEFTLNIDDTLTIGIFPYGTPGDADGDGNPDASSDPNVPDTPGVGLGERINMGLICDGGVTCAPNAAIIYTNNTLIVNPASAAQYVTFDLLVDRYQINITDLSAFKFEVLGYIPTDVEFGAFSLSASFRDLQVDDFTPDRDATTGALVCELITLIPPVIEAPGTGTIGYWKNHAAEWPAGCELNLPGSESDPDVFAMNVLQAPVKGDKTIALAKQLVAAKLNACAGNDSSCIDQEIADATAWLQSYPVFSKQRSWLGADLYQENMDDYNNGKLSCAVHRD